MYDYIIHEPNSIFYVNATYYFLTSLLDNHQRNPNRRSTEATNWSSKEIGRATWGTHFWIL